MSAVGERVDVEELQARLARVETTLAGLEAAGAAPAAKHEPARPLVPYFADVHAWVEQLFVPTFARRVGSRLRWCAQWWDHAEALLRLEALWRSWEALRLDPTLGIATWLRDYLDPQLAALMNPDGPFQGCDDTTHYPPAPLPSAARPAEQGDRP
ncbi:MAG: DUF4913 domain-containing protein [Acidimicrobiia bacterium]